jgi:hypothetical protein
LQLEEDGAATFVYVEGVGVGELLDADADGVTTGEFKCGAVGLGTYLCVAYVFEQDDAASSRVVLDDDVLKLFGVGETAYDADCHLELLFGVRGWLAELAGGDLDVLLGKGIGDVECGETAGGEEVGIEPDAHGVLALAEDDDGADTGDTLECIADVDVEIVGDEAGGERVIGGDEAGGEDEVGVGLGDGDAGVVDDCWETALRRGYAVLHVDGGDVEIVAGLEGDGDGGGAVVGAGGAHVTHALDAVDGLLEDDGDRGFNVLGVGPNVVAGDDDLRRSESWVERDR